MRWKVPHWAAGATFVVAILTGAGAHAAPDPKAVADAMVAAFGATGKATATYDSAVSAGDDITITGFKATQPDRKGRDIDVATIVVSGAAERQPGGFTATRMSFSGGSATYRQNEIRWQTAIVEDAVIPTVDEVKAMSDTYRPFAKATTTGIAVSGPQLSEPVNVDRVEVMMGADTQGMANSFTMSADGIVVPASALDSPEAQGMLQGLGYTDLVVSIAIDAGFDSAADTFTLRSMAVNVADVGKIMVAGKFSRVKVHNMAGTDKAAANSSADTSPMIDSLTVRLDNAGVVERALDMQAQILGTTREGVADQWPMLLMFLMGDAGGMDFQMKLQAALTEFLKDPKSLTVTVAPAAPVSLDQLAETLEEDQTKLPDLLAVGIAANH